MKKIYELNSDLQWNELKNSTGDKQVIIFKYSPICPISYEAEDNFDKWFSGLNDETNLTAAKINVLKSSAVSRKIANDLDIWHESPQVILLNSNGKVVWSGSHYEINGVELAKLNIVSAQ